MKLSTLALITLFFAASCGKSKKSDDTPAPPQNNQQNQTPANGSTDKIDSDLAGTWNKSETQQGFIIDVTFVFKTDATGQNITKVGDETAVDMDFAFATDAAASPRHMTLKVTKVTTDASDNPMKAGETVKCIYQLNSPTELKLNCNEKSVDSFPADFGGDAMILTKKG